MQKFIFTLTFFWAISGSEADTQDLKRNIRSAVQRGDLGLLQKYINYVNLNPINLDNRHGYKMLAVACWAGQDKVVKFFLDHGADINAISEVKSGRLTALDVAMMSNQYAIAEYLKTKGAISFSDLDCQ